MKESEENEKLEERKQKRKEEKTKFCTCTCTQNNEDRYKDGGSDKREEIKPKITKKKRKWKKESERKR